MSRHALPRRSPRDFVARSRAADRPTKAAPTPARHSTPRPGPARKPALLLSAAVAGALVAALPMGAGAAEGLSPTSDYVVAGPLDSSVPFADDGASAAEDGNGELIARKELTAADAEARLKVLREDRASRASRADAARADAARAEAARAEAARPRFVLPTQGRLSTCFCQRWGTMHWGIDLAAPMYTPILAVADAVVVTAGPASGFGNVVELQHDDGTVSRYGHMETIEVEVGDIVTAGQLIAKVGSRGFSTGPHLHLEILPHGLTGERVDPKQWLADRGVAV